jgi:hypothetical protein
MESMQEPDSSDARGRLIELMHDAGKVCREFEALTRQPSHKLEAVEGISDNDRARWRRAYKAYQDASWQVARQR